MDGLDKNIAHSFPKLLREALLEFLNLVFDTQYPDEWTSQTLTAFFYKLGESGRNYMLKENHRIPYEENEFSSLKKMSLYIG